MVFLIHAGFAGRYLALAAMLQIGNTPYLRRKRGKLQPDFSPAPSLMRLFARLLALISLTLPALAAESPDFYLGAGAYHRSGPYQAKQAHSVEPTGDYDGERFFVHGDELGIKFWRSGTLTASAMAQTDLLAFRASDATQQALTQLRDREAFVGAGLELQWQLAKADTFRAAVLGDVAGHSGGQRATVYYEHDFELPGSYTQIAPYLGASWLSRREAAYYFGIDPSEATRSGLPAFAPAHSSRFNVGLAIVQPLSKQVALFADASRHQLGGAGDSAMLRQTHYAEVNIGVVFRVNELLP